MKRLILLSTFFLFIFASCDGPVDHITGSKQKPTFSNNVAPDISYSAEPVRPDTTRRAAWQQFKAQNGNGWNVRWNQHTGLPISVFSGKTEKDYRGNPEAAARAFLTEYRALFGMKSNLSGLQYKKTHTNRYGLRRVAFQQQYKGIPVEGAQYIVHIYEDGRIGMANGYYYPNLEVSTSPAVSKSQALSAALSDLNIPSQTAVQPDAKLVIYKAEDQFHLAWKQTLFSKTQGIYWRYVVDAHSGIVLYKLNLVADVTGDGDVYPTSPCLSSITNNSLYGLTGNGYLAGTYVSVYNSDVSRAYSSVNSFQYAASNTHFDEVSLYYHIDNFRRNFIESLDANNELFEQLNAYARTTIIGALITLVK